MARTDFSDYSVDDWYYVMHRSIREPIIEGVEMPRFPHPSIQRAYVGTADEAALETARNFHSYATKWAAGLGHPLNQDSKILDFGSSWGRVIRYFWHETKAENLHGVDVDFDAVATCRNLGVPGKFDVISPTGTLPYTESAMDLIFALSVFTHLSEKSADHWMKELHRVAKGGCVLAITVESRKYLEDVANLPADVGGQDLRAQLASRYRKKIPKMIKDFDAGKFVFMANGTDGTVRDNEFYGDAMISEAYFKKRWGHLFRLVTYIEAHHHVGQAIIIAIKD